MFGICGAGEFKFGTSIDHGKSLLSDDKSPPKGCGQLRDFYNFWATSYRRNGYSNAVHTSVSYTDWGRWMPVQDRDIDAILILILILY